MQKGQKGSNQKADRSKQPQAAQKNATSGVSTPSTAGSNPGTHTTAQPPQIPRWKATILLGGFYAVLLGILGGVVLYAIGRLPQPVIILASSVNGVIVVLVTLAGLFLGSPTQEDKNRTLSKFQTIQQRARPTIAITSGLIVAVVILIIPSFIFAASSGKTTVSGSTSTTNFTPIPTPTPTKWVSVLKQTAPNCNNPPGVAWYVYSGGTHYTCYSSGGTMQQTTSTAYAEMDLTNVKSGSYTLTHFRVQTRVAFQSPGDTSTWAALLVQTPATHGAPGGYIFTVSPDGHCVLQYVETDQTIPIEAQASVNIDPHQLVQMMVIVQGGELYTYVNGQQVFTHADTLGLSPSDVSLMVERQNAGPSSLIEFSNFEVDAAS